MGKKQESKNPRLTKPVGQECKKYGIAITNFVLGEDLRMPPAELYHHLRDCPKCRAELEDWQAVYATMRTEAYHKTPEAKQKYQELLEKIRQLPGPVSRRPIDFDTQVGDAAGAIWRLLAKNGEARIDELPKQVNLPDYLVLEAVGWLARENKLMGFKDDRKAYIRLTEKEQQITRAGL